MTECVLILARFSGCLHACCNFSGYKPLQQVLKASVVPSQFLWTPQPSVQSLSRTARLQTRRNEKEKKSFDVPDCQIINTVVDEELTVGLAVEVFAESTPSSSIQLTDAESQTVNEATQTAHASVQTNEKLSFTFMSITNNDKAVHFYTGLENYAKFKFVLASLGPASNSLSCMYGDVEGIHVEDQFLMVLMKLRRYTTNFELAMMFGVCESQVYNVFCTWIRFMSLQWRELDLWPSRDVVNFFMPSDFRRKFPKTRVVLDGTECPIKTPKLPLAQQATFSTYKNRSTVKVLVGATPSGLVSFVSPAYGGSTSDRQIVERSSLPSLCDSGDSIMADKGFAVQDMFAPFNVQVNIPTFFRNKNQMQSKTILHDRKVSSKRVHIERIIGLGKTYKILTQPMNHSETQLSSDIIFVCYMLCNFRSCIVSKTA